jgi:hypothetical protein
MSNRYVYAEDGFWCDTTLPWDSTHRDFDPELTPEEDGPWYEEVDPGEVMNDQDAEITNLRAQLVQAQAIIEDLASSCSALLKRAEAAEEKLNA